MFFAGDAYSLLSGISKIKCQSLSTAETDAHKYAKKKMYEMEYLSRCCLAYENASLLWEQREDFKSLTPSSKAYINNLALY